MNHKQHGNNFRLIPDRADRAPALLSRLGIDTVGSDEATLVLENEGGQFK